MTKKLTKIYRPIIFVEYLSIAIGTAIAGIQILMLNDFMQIVSAVMTCLASLTDVFIYAYGAQTVLDSAEEVFDYLEKIDKRYFVPILVSHKRLYFDARFFSSSLHTLSVLMSRISSIIALLKSLV